MARTLSEYCDDIIVWAISLCSWDYKNQTDAFPPLPDDNLLSLAEQGLNVNIQSDPKIVDTPDSTTHAVIFGDDGSSTQERRDIIEWRTDLDI